MRLENQVAVVTGAAGGLGRAFCLALAQEGAKIVAADINPCADLVDTITAIGGEAIAVETDVASAASTKAMVRQAIDRFGAVDILINNAALLASLTDTPFEEIDEAEWDRVMAVNVKGMWQCAKAMVPFMRQRGRGRIINISSGTVWLGLPMYLHYVTSKGAVISFTKALARELAGSGINVNAVTPGYTLTEAALGMADEATIEQFKQQIIDAQIIKRNELPEDVTGPVVFLAAAESDFISGQIINVDGGAAHH